MSKKVQDLLQKYERLLLKGRENIKHLESVRLEHTEQFHQQKVLNSIWTMVIKDFRSLADEMTNENKKTRT